MSGSGVIVPAFSLDRRLPSDRPFRTFLNSQDWDWNPRLQPFELSSDNGRGEMEQSDARGLIDTLRSMAGGCDVSVYEMERATGSLEVLIYLFLNGSSSKTKVFEALEPSHETLARTIAVLKKLNLVSVVNETSFPYRQLCRLTESGRRVVESPVYDWPGLLWEPPSPEERIAVRSGRLNESVRRRQKTRESSFSKSD